MPAGPDSRARRGPASRAPTRRRRTAPTSAFAADLVERTAECVRIAVELKWPRQSPPGGARDTTLCDQPVERRRPGRGRSELGDRTVAVGDDEALAALDATQGAAEVLT